ncbi:hypothetical protein IH601_05030 [Candidatus Bipolaricaulota bacterium]|nr:hypothetical protein [Candidatus Bipolaricaulota bacterium]TFH10523.1 MAG: hypothetical protein E4H08_03485 [Candidatus Atribacteria bacterium]
MGTLERLLLWMPRVLAMALALFLAMFAMDAYVEGAGFLETSRDFFAHLLPSFCVLVILVVGWRRDGLAALGFLLLAGTFFVALSGWRSPQALMLVLPPLGVGLAFAARMWLIRKSNGASDAASSDNG